MFRTLTICFLTIFSALSFASPTLAEKSKPVPTVKNNEMICLDPNDLSDERKIELMQASYFPMDDEDVLIRRTKQVPTIGIGIEINQDGRILSVIDGAPAARAGIPAQGKVHSVNGITLKTGGLSMLTAEHDNTDIGTIVRLAVETDDAQIKVYTLSREKFFTEVAVPMSCFKKLHVNGE
jgi:predicted metalloprotease with PDZ domain